MSRFDYDEDEFDEDEDYGGVLKKAAAREVHNQKRLAIQTAESDLYMNYGIFPGMPLKARIHRLYVMCSMDAQDIADVLKQPLDYIKKEVKVLEQGWEKGSLSPEQTRREKNRAIAELEQIKIEVDAQYNKTKDPKFLTIRNNLTERIIKMKGLDVDMEVDTGENPVQTLSNALAELSPRRLEKLHKILSSF